jgi:putative ABC transport system permease protein
MKTWWSKVRAAFGGRRRLDADLREELDAHLEMEVQGGTESREAVQRRFGNPTAIREQARETWSFGSFEDFGKDILHAGRLLRKNPAFAATAVLTLALGIGGNTAMFTVIHAVLLKPLAYQDPGRLVRIPSEKHLTPVRYQDLRTAAKSFTEVGAYAIAPENMTLSGGAEPESIRAARVSANFLRILGIAPALGRSFLPEEDTPGGPAVAMISAELWQRRFGGDPLVAGRTATLGTVPYTIVGVLPAGFQFPFSGLDVWVAQPTELSLIPPTMRSRSSIVIGFARLKDGVSLDQARAELDVLSRQYMAAHPGMPDASPGEQMIPGILKDQLVAEVRSTLWMLSGAVGFVLLIACANVASLLLARAASRSREFALRAALGAGRRRLIGQLLAESVLLAGAGGALGVLLAKWSLSAIPRLTSFNLPRAAEIQMDWSVLGFALALSIATGVLFGLVPSLGASRPDLAGVLRASGEAAGRGSSKRYLGIGARGVLVIGQVALSLVLLIGSGLLIESLVRLRGVDPGFQPANVLTMHIALPPARYDTDPKRAAFFDELVRRVEAVPGVRSATVALTAPTTGYLGTRVQVAERPTEKLSERTITAFQSISPDYFRTLEIPLRRGREFTGSDKAGTRPVIMINETFARHFWPEYPNGLSPVGQHLLMGVGSTPLEIVGIVQDAHDLDLDPRPEMYQPLLQLPQQSMVLEVRTQGDPKRFIKAVRSEVLAVDRDQPVTAIKTLEEIVDASVGQQRLSMILLGVFAGVALLLAMVGLYGVIAYSVTQRTREVGVRRALGAQQGDILRLVLSQGLGLTLAGVVAGIGGALALTRVMKNLLFHVSATDPATFAGIALLLVVVALAASYVPARRAMRIDPMEALR